MSDPSSALQVELSIAPLRETDADLLVVPIFENDDLADLPGLDEASGGELGRALANREFKARPYDTFLTPITDRSWRTRRFAFVGAGRPEAWALDRARRVAATAGVLARQRRMGKLAIVNRGRLDEAPSVQAIAEGLILADFDPGTYKTKDRDDHRMQTALIVTRTDSTAAREAVRRGVVLGESSNVARAFANEPGNVLTPAVFADRAAEVTRAVGLSVTILDERAIAGLNMGLLLGVSRGSAEPPRMIVIRHEPPGAPATPVLALVGKGVTFDTGGISIKPADGMERMKDDMAGGAAVIAAMRAVALLKAPIRVIGIVPATENMPGSRAIKPGDVLTSASGKTVEVINTDAEGRLILGDALWYARELGATRLVDVATLTGACVVALGRTTTGIFGTPTAWVEHVREVANRAGDQSWPMPVFDEYRELLRSEIADIVNSAGRPAGAITAAMFLKEFTGDLPWAHLDIAGTAWAEDAKPYQPKGPTGVAVRTLAELAFTSSDWNE